MMLLLSDLATYNLHFGHCLQCISFAMFVSITSFPLSSRFSFLNSLHSIPSCHRTLHCPQNILLQLGHSKFLTASVLSLIKIAEQSAKGQLNFSVILNKTSQTALFHRLKSSVGRIERQNSSSNEPLHPKAGHLMLIMLWSSL
jgi:hypothetical protein